MNNLNTISKLLLNRVQHSSQNNSVGWIQNKTLKFIKYHEYFKTIESLGLGLMGSGLESQNKVAILAKTSKEWHFLDMAIMCTRGVVVPIYPTYLAEEIEFILDHSETKILIIENDQQLQKVLPKLNNLNKLELIISIEKIDRELIVKIPSRFKHLSYSDLYKIGAEESSQNKNKFTNSINITSSVDIASIIYTSGTTGVPKGAVITHGGMSKMLRNAYRGFEGVLGEKDRSLTWLPLSHVFGRCDSFMHLVFGWETIYSTSVDRIINELQLVKPTIMMAVPRIFEKIYAKIMSKVNQGSPVEKELFNWAQIISKKYFSKLANDLSPSVDTILMRKAAYKIVYKKIFAMFGGKLRFLISGGAPLSKGIIEFLRNCNLTILEGYGLTETIGPICINPAYKQVPGTVGRPLGEVQIKIADDGEILVKTEGMLTEYFKNSEATAESIVDGWFLTGDIGQFGSDGFLKITDRKKEILITSGGKNIAPQKIENLAKMYPHISQLVLIADKRKYSTAIVGIEKDHFIDDLKLLGLQADCRLEDLAKNKQVFEIIKKEINQLNEHLARYESIKKFYISPVDFSIDNGLITPSLKVKRKAVYNRFSHEIENMYS